MLPLTGKDFIMPQDGFFQISSLGEFPKTFENGTVLIQVVDGDSVQRMLAAFANDAAQPNFGGLLVDFDHFSMNPLTPSKAAGWVTELQGRPDGLYAKIRWSKSGEESVQSGEYRWPSPVWEFEEIVNSRVRPVHLLSVALTNDPNIKNMRPLSNRVTKEGGIMPDPAKGAETPATPQGSGEFAAVLTALGLKPGATLGDALASIANRDSSLATLQKQALETQAEADLEEFKDVIANREEVKKSLIANRDLTRKVLLAARKETPKNPQKAVVNRAGNTLPTGGAPAGDDAKEKARCARISNRAAEIATTQRLNYQTAWSRAEAEFPKEG